MEQTPCRRREAERNIKPARRRGQLGQIVNSTVRRHRVHCLGQYFANTRTPGVHTTLSDQAGRSCRPVLLALPHPPLLALL